MENTNKNFIIPSLGQKILSAFLLAGAIMGVGIFLTPLLVATHYDSARFFIFFVFTGIHPKGYILFVPILFFVLSFVLCFIGLFVTKKIFSRNVKIFLLILAALYPLYFLVYVPYHTKQVKIESEERQRLENPKEWSSQLDEYRIRGFISPPVDLLLAKSFRIPEIPSSFHVNRVTFGGNRLAFEMSESNPPNTLFITEFLSDPLPADMKRLKIESEKEFNNILVKFDNGKYFEMIVWSDGDDPNAEYGRAKMQKILDWFIKNSR